MDKKYPIFKAAENFSDLIFDSALYNQLKILTAKGQTLDGYSEESGGYFIKPISEIDADGFESFNDIYYTVEPPKSLTSKEPNRLVVIFSDAAGSTSSKAITRYYSNENFLSISYLVNKPNLYVLRVADCSGITGLYFQNTEFDDTYEDRIQGLIKKIQRDYQIISNQVVLFGVSRGGAGALLHGIIGGYKAVATDPVISLNYSPNDIYLLYGTLSNFIKRFNQLVERASVSCELTILTSERSLYTYPFYQELKCPGLNLVNVSQELPQNIIVDYHAAFIGSMKYVSISYLKKALGVMKENSRKLLTLWDVFPPYFIPYYYFTGKWSLDKGMLTIERTSKHFFEEQPHTWIKWEFKEKPIVGKEYELQIQMIGRLEEVFVFVEAPDDWERLEFNANMPIRFTASHAWKGIAIAEQSMAPREKIEIEKITLKELN